MNNKMAINTYLSTMTLNANGLNVPIKRHRVAGWITPLQILSKRLSLQTKRYTLTESKGIEKGIS